MPAGRPSKYDPKFCKLVVDLGAKGKSPEQISAKINVPRATMQLWAKQHPEFLAALERAKELEQDWWEEQGQKALYADRFQASVWAKSMQARFREKYTEKQQLEHSGPNGGAIQTAVSISVNFLTPGADQ